MSRKLGVKLLLPIQPKIRMIGNGLRDWNCAYAFQLSGNDVETVAHYKNVQ